MELIKFLNENMEIFGKFLIQNKYFPYVCDTSSQVLGAYINENIEKINIIEGYYENSDFFHVFLLRENGEIIDFTLCQFFDEEESIKESFFVDEYLDVGFSKSFREDILEKYQLPLIIEEDDELYDNYYQEKEIRFHDYLILLARENNCFSKYLERAVETSKIELVSA